MSEGCPMCGGSAPSRPTGPAATYCSRKCRDAASYLRRKDAGTLHRQPPKPKVLRMCAGCGQAFRSNREAMTCSSACATRYRDRTGAAQCSEQSCVRGVRAKGLCAMHWRRLARAEGREKPPAWSESRHANWKRREALKRGAPDAERIVHREVFERDRWICGLCAEPVNPERSWPDALSASLDHIIPLSKRGPHTMANVQLAHLGCNVEKGDRIAA